MRVVQLMLAVCDNLGIAMSPPSLGSNLETYRPGR